jgi:prepilin-type N-terminal cleavage/methylation domain-containing protein
MVRKKRAGFTLVELMMVVIILGIISSVGAGIMLQVNRYFLLTRVRIDLQKQARSSLYLMTREIRQAKAATIVIDRAATNQPFYSRITFTTIDGRQFRFQQVGSKLQQVVGNGTTTLSTNLCYLAFTFPRSDDMTILSVAMTLQEATFQGQEKALHMASENVQVMN